jgi:hypothetical protein
VTKEEDTRGAVNKANKGEQAAFGEESEAVTKEEDESEDELMVTERKEPVPKWEVLLAENKAVWEQLDFASN